MRPLLLRLAALALTGFLTSIAAAQSDPGASLAELRRMSARFVPTPLVVDTSALTSGDRKALVKLIEAARIVDELYLDQVWSGNAAEYARLRADHSPLGARACTISGSARGPGPSSMGSRPSCRAFPRASRRVPGFIPRT